MNKLIIIVLIIAFIVYINSGVRENIGSDFFHRGKLADINQHIQKQVAEARDRYMGKTEGFEAKLEELPKEYKPELKDAMKGKPLEQYDPSRYVISEYSFKALKPVEEKALDQVQVGELEDANFTKPVDYSGEKGLADYLEVDSYNTGSGDMGQLNEAYKMVNKEQYFQTLKALRVRGGNVFIYPTKPCTAPVGDVVGFA